jgi:hypothetical protein
LAVFPRGSLDPYDSDIGASTASPAIRDLVFVRREMTK